MLLRSSTAANQTQTSTPPHTRTHQGAETRHAEATKGARLDRQPQRLGDGAVACVIVIVVVVVRCVRRWMTMVVHACTGCWLASRSIEPDPFLSIR